MTSKIIREVGRFVTTSMSQHRNDGGIGSDSESCPVLHRSATTWK